MFDSYEDVFAVRGRAYSEAMRRFQDARDEEFLAMVKLAEISGGDRVVDAPSGGGFLRRYLPANIDYVGVDPCASFLDVEEIFHGVAPEIRIGQLHQLPLDEASVSHVCSLAGLHHLENKTDFYQEARRILKPGGRLAVGDAWTGSRTARFLDECVSAHNPDGHHGEYLDHDVVEALERLGFVVEPIQHLEYFWNFPSTADMVEYCRLLFGLSLSTPAQILQGLREYLGFEEGPSMCRLHWGLSFLAATKV